MTDIRQFIRNLGDDAPTFFGTKPDTIKKWLRTGSVPIKAAQKIFAAESATIKTLKQQEPPKPEQETDPYSGLPLNIDRRLPNVQSTTGGMPSVIEMNPAEQSFGVNMTRPGRIQRSRTLPPMKIKEVNGQKVAYIDDSPKAPTVLPPSIPKDNTWTKNDAKQTPEKTESVSQA
jgi:hypothetical protein